MLIMAVVLGIPAGLLNAAALEKEFQDPPVAAGPAGF
jgi:hypothetical protein